MLLWKEINIYFEFQFYQQWVSGHKHNWIDLSPMGKIFSIYTKISIS